jgi:hypothetical protein
MGVLADHKAGCGEAAPPNWARPPWGDHFASARGRHLALTEQAERRPGCRGDAIGQAGGHLPFGFFSEDVSAKLLELCIATC